MLAQPCYDYTDTRTGGSPVLDLRVYEIPDRNALGRYDLLMRLCGTGCPAPFAVE